MDKEKFYATMGARSQTASSKRNIQLKNWDKGDTNKQSDIINPSRLQPRVQFGDTVVFLAAAQSGDVEEVERLLQEGADVNAVNSDGLTGLHQCCIDDDFQMVETLVKHGANVDAQDNEGWSPLHAAASCGHEHIVRFLLESNAHPALVNNEGDTPLDLADDHEEIAELISSHIDTNNIDVDAAKNLEEAQMLADANRLKNDPALVSPISPGGATLLHIAAAKGYLSVMEVLLSMKVEVDALDDDGWTPLHAAIYWRNMEAAKLLVSHGADITRTTKIGDTIEDLVDPELADKLDSLKKLKEEHNNRHRCYAVSTRSTRPSLTHTNSRDEMKSPNLLRRRSSKERSMAVHKLDKEREKFPDYPSNNSINTSIISTELNNKSADVSTLPTNNHNTNEGKSSEDRELAQESKNCAKEEALLNEDQSTEPINHSPVISSSESSPTGSPSTTPRSVVIGKMAPGTKSSPKIGKKGMSPNMMKRVGLWESQSTLAPLASSTPSTDKTEAKKYVFQARTISDISTRSNSLDLTSTKKPSPSVVVGRQTTYDHTAKRASYDERKLKEGLSPPTTEYKTSSLPRGATVSPVLTPVVSTSLPRGSKINTPDKDKSKDRLAVTDELLESKIKDSVDGTVSSSGDPTPGAETADQELGARSVAEEVSGDSTVSNRSTSESETKRKQHARRSRQQRQPTQPVDNEILQRLLQRDKIKEEQESAESSPEVKPKNSMSAYKPSSRPVPRTPNSSQPQALPWSVHLGVEQESSPDSSPPVKSKQLELDESPSTASEAGDDKSTSSQHPRSKSTARRRPKKERRSTGLPFEAEEGEHIPEELANFIVRKPTDTSVVESSIVSESGGEELSRLRQELEEERKWRENLAGDKDEISRELEALKSKVSELTRRHGDATRAYEQEKKERELQEARILELENGSKNLQDLKKECQRLKDENSALIRVIGKLSRSPLPSSTV